MKEYILKTGRKGSCAGEAFILKEINLNTDRKITDVDAEINAFNDAVNSLAEQLKGASSNASGDSATIFNTELLFLEDNYFHGQILDAIRNEHICASMAVQKAGDGLAKVIESAESEYLRGRSEDVRGMVKQLISIIEGEAENLPDRPFILIAHEFSPVQFSALPKDRLLGIITAKGSSTSHLSVLADSFGVAYLFGLDEADLSIKDGNPLIISGEKLITDPSDEDYAAALSLFAPADGYLIPMEDIPDEAFSKGSMGKCFGIMPDNGKIYAPCDGVITAIAQTKHAITIGRSRASDILIHVGIDTVKLAGKGFTLHVKEGDPVKKDDLLMEADINMITSKGFSPMVITVY